ncbi:MAG: hypothetical protein QOE36_2833, partial [Gaiellaceae bacterium]|nr:hypothetical protein [Gaiellaceae bacterium]
MATETAVDVVMPQMGVSVSEGTITKWLKQEGEHIEADESLLEISTDKVDTEVPSPASGTVTQILVQEGETVEVGTKLAQIGGAAPSTEPAEEEAPPEPATQAAADASMAAASEGVGDVAPSSEGSSSEVPAPEAPQAPAPTATSDASGNGDKTFVSPVVARIASEHGIDPNQVSGSGRGGRVTKKDILAFVEGGGATAAPADAPAQPAPTPAPPAAAPATVSGQESQAPGDGETLEPMSAMRRGIAEHMRRSLDTSAHVTSA